MPWPWARKRRAASIVSRVLPSRETVISSVGVSGEKWLWGKSINSDAGSARQATPVCSWISAAPTSEA